MKPEEFQIVLKEQIAPISQIKQTPLSNPTSTLNPIQKEQMTPPSFFQSETLS